MNNHYHRMNDLRIANRKSDQNLKIVKFVFAAAIFGIALFILKSGLEYAETAITAAF